MKIQIILTIQKGPKHKTKNKKITWLSSSSSSSSLLIPTSLLSLDSALPPLSPPPPPPLRYHFLSCCSISDNCFGELQHINTSRLISIHSNKFLKLQPQHITVIERPSVVSEPTPTSVHYEGWMDDKWSQQQLSVEFQFPSQPWWLAQLLFLLPTY